MPPHPSLPPPIHPPPPQLHPLPHPSPSFFPFLSPFHFPPPLPCFPPQFGTFPYPFPPPPSLPSPSPPPQGSNHVLTKLPKVAPAPLATPITPTKENSQNIPPLPQSSNHRGSKRSFCIDAKLFSFSFDWGRSDSYAIHETRRGVKSSIWVGCRGLEWILTCLADIRDWVPGRAILCKRLRENGKLTEFCGRFKQIWSFGSYYGLFKQSCIMIPASYNRAGWSLFQRELRSFFIGAKPASLAEASSTIGGGGGGGGKIVGGNQSGKFLSTSVINGRPKRAFYFKLTPASLALRVCKPEGGKRKVICMDAKELRWPMVSSDGPEVIKHIGESSRGSSRDNSGSPVFAVAPKSKEDHPDEVARAMEAPKPGFSGGVVTYRRKRDVTHSPIASLLRIGSTRRLMGIGIVVSSNLQHQGAAQNSFAPLSGLASKSFAAAVEQGCRKVPKTLKQVVAAKSSLTQDSRGAANPKHLMLDPRKSNFANLSSQTQDSRRSSLGKEYSLSGEKIFSADGADGMSLELSFKLDRGPSGKWEISWSKITEVDPSMGQASNPKPSLSFKPNFVPLINHIPNPKPFQASNPKPTPIRNPSQPYPIRGPNSKPKAHPLSASTSFSTSKPKLKNTFKWKPKPYQPSAIQSQTHPLSFYSLQAPPSHLISPATAETGSDEPVAVPLPSHMEPTSTEKFLLVPDNFEASMTESSCSDASVDGSLCSDNEVALHRDIQRIIHEHTDNAIRKWGNSE
ncbi:hypothetical protein CMV_008223 [Castanea mollissima]|uniref:Uncharacterized protein n=1 Tax=Castanea mollissima TaxID=60419 RepID=A0A8J4R7R7_9ROSI|nr:hypothetical protein CMV_008223 [Castanea mollissima]